MTISTNNSTITTSPSAFMRVGDQTLRDRQNSFAGVLSRRQDATASTQDKATQAARDFVAVAFIQPVMKQLRETDNAAAPFAAGPAEKKFRSLLDASHAQHLVKAANFPLVDRIASDILRAGNRAGASALPTAAMIAGASADLASPSLKLPSGGFAR